MSKYEYRERIVPFEHAGRSVGYQNNPRRMDEIRAQAEMGWRYVSSIVFDIHGKDISFEGYPTHGTRPREVMTFEREVE